ncbi:choice-of-anchor Q domain-containing protein [Pseudolysobacter antarcticus]|uniref:choice-of-anchor Q domain-containing protein n=1 Tax=Pseudolysobacter antarcticus TaxID=2511995 RepID=UPI001A90CDE8|nr:choice-of-anchor Q domain-containing protein [Pseudolysobacter antarcticus]
MQYRTKIVHHARTIALSRDNPVGIFFARKKIIRAAACALVFAGFLPLAAQATSVACTGTTGDSAGLIAAIAAANSGSGDTIDLAAGCTYAFSAADNFWYGPNALPPITATIVINGHGATLLASHSGDPSPVAANAFRFFYVSGGLQLAAGSLSLNTLTLAGGYARGGDSTYGGGGGGFGGAIFNQGTLNLSAVTLSGNTARGGGGIGDANNPQYIGSAGGGMGEDAGANVFHGGGFGGPLSGTYIAGLGGAGGSGGGGGGGGFIVGANGDAGGASNVSAQGANGGGNGHLGGVGYPGITGDGGAGGNIGQYVGNVGGAGGGGVGGGGGPPGGGSGQGGDFGGGGTSGYGTGGAGGFGGGGGTSGGGFGTTGGAGGFGGGGGGAGGYGAGNGVGGRGGFGGGGGSSSDSIGGGGGGFGGAIFNHTGNVSLTNVTLSGNSAIGGPSVFFYDNPGRNGSGLGGAIFNLNGEVTLNFCTVAGNSVANSNNAVEGPGDGSALYSLAYGNRIEDGTASNAAINLGNSIVWGNIGAVHALLNTVIGGTSGSNGGNSALLAYVGSNIVDSSSGNGSSSGPAPLSGDPKLGGLQDNGGGTPTMALQNGSAAIDAGSHCGALPATDQRGNMRNWGAEPDLGAYESGAPLGSNDEIFHGAFEAGVVCP